MMGMGVIQPETLPMPPQPGTDQAPRNYSAWYCSLPFADFFDACKVPTLAELEAEHRQELSRIAAVNPVLAQQAFETGQRLTAADCAANPESCAQFTFAGQNPDAAALIGAGPGSRTVYETVSSLTDFSTPTPWLVLAVIGAFVFMKGK